MLGGQRDLEQTRTRLREWLRGKMPAAEGLAVSAFKKPSAGLSNETFLFDLSWREGGLRREEKLVARLQPTAFQVFPDYDLSLQFRIMRCLADTEVPVPKVRWLEEDTSILGCSFYVMEQVEGAIPSEVPPYHSFGLCLDATLAGRAKMWWSGIDTLACIHTLDWRALGLAFLGVPGGGTDPLDRQLAFYERYLDWVRGDSAQPVLDAALRWLKENKFSPARVALCWGDSRLPNLIFRDDQVVAVLDWEMAVLGDPEADLGWWLFLDWTSCTGYGFSRLEGFPSREETIRHYEARTGWKVEHVFYYEVWAAFRFGVIMARIATRLKEIGAPIPTADFESNNVCTQALARFLELPSPGDWSPAGSRAEGGSVRIQFHLTGPKGYDWYLVSEAGRGARHEGTVEAPEVTLTATLADWQAIQKGELSRTEAFLGGKLKIDGDLSLLMQLEDTISKLSGE